MESGSWVPAAFFTGLSIIGVGFLLKRNWPTKTITVKNPLKRLYDVGWGKVVTEEELLTCETTQDEAPLTEAIAKEHPEAGNLAYDFSVLCDTVAEFPLKEDSTLLLLFREQDRQRVYAELETCKEDFGGIELFDTPILLLTRVLSIERLADLPVLYRFIADLSEFDPAQKE